MADRSPRAQSEGFDQPSSQTVPHMIVLRTATLMYVPGAGVYTAQILRKSGSDVSSLSVLQIPVQCRGGVISSARSRR